jgi:N6-adenosine-specific RNA methylase IME4
MANVQPTPKHNGTALTLPDACRLIGELKDLRDLRGLMEVRDYGQALQAFAERRGLGKQAQNDGAEMKLRAERAMGELIAEMGKQGPGEYKRLHDATVCPSYRDLGIEKTAAHRWQKIADIPEQRFDGRIEEVRGREDGELTSADLLRLAKELQREEQRRANRDLVEQAAPLEEVAAQPGQTWPTVVIDPPWSWGDEGDVSQFGRGDPNYATMPYGELLELKVGELAAKDSHCYLWITNRSLPKGFALLGRWGFRYVTCLTWCKPSIGMGNYFRGSTEHVLFGVRGSLPLLRNDVGTWFAAPRQGRHSSKPAEFFGLVESCSPGPWLEEGWNAMTTRSSWPGWTARWRTSPPGGWVRRPCANPRKPGGALEAFVRGDGRRSRPGRRFCGRGGAMSR